MSKLSRIVGHLAGVCKLLGGVRKKTHTLKIGIRVITGQKRDEGLDQRKQAGPPVAKRQAGGKGESESSSDPSYYSQGFIY